MPPELVMMTPPGAEGESQQDADTEIVDVEEEAEVVIKETEVVTKEPAVVKEVAVDEVAELPEKGETSIVVSVKKTIRPVSVRSGKTPTSPSMSSIISPLPITSAPIV